MPSNQLANLSNQVCDACDDGVIDIPLVLGLFMLLLIGGGIIISGVIKQLDDHGMITDMRLVIGFYQLLGQMDNILDVQFPEPVPTMMSFIELMVSARMVSHTHTLTCVFVSGLLSPCWYAVPRRA